MKKEGLSSHRDIKSINYTLFNKIIQIISKGTNVNNESLNEKENNYIASIYNHDYSYTITYTDITTITGKIVDNPSQRMYNYDNKVTLI